MKEILTEVDTRQRTPLGQDIPEAGTVGTELTPNLMNKRETD
jgi:hypothetical protein